jgi:magnesium-transporting ATPase (P-type)
MIVADARIIKGSQLRVEESALTGESEPVEKEVDFVATGDESLGDQINM